MKTRKIVLIFLIAAAGGLQCTSPSEPDPTEIKTVFEPPTITGFYVTTLEHPDGTGEVIGKKQGWRFHVLEF